MVSRFSLIAGLVESCTPPPSPCSRARPVAGLALALFCLLAVFAGPAHAQIILVSNVGHQVLQQTPVQILVQTGLEPSIKQAQGFTTGPYNASLASVDIRLHTAPDSGDSVTVTINTATEVDTDDGDTVLHPDTVLVTMTAPTTYQTGINTFEAPSDTTVTLSADTTYFVVISGNSGVLHATRSPGESSRQPGWSINSSQRQRHWPGYRSPCPSQEKLTGQRILRRRRY